MGKKEREEEVEYLGVGRDNLAPIRDSQEEWNVGQKRVLPVFEKLDDQGQIDYDHVGRDEADSDQQGQAENQLPFQRAVIVVMHQNVEKGWDDDR